MLNCRKKRKICLDDGTILEISEEEDSIFENENDTSLNRDEEYFYDYEDVLNEETLTVEVQRIKKIRKKILDDDEKKDLNERIKKRYETNDGTISNPELVIF